jgi:hypothetical protein
MIQSSTYDQLILLAYGELNGAEASALLARIGADAELAGQWDTIKNLTGELDKGMVAPSDTSLKIVLEYSNKTEHLQEI